MQIGSFFFSSLLLLSVISSDHILKSGKNQVLLTFYSGKNQIKIRFSSGCVRNEGFSLNLKSD